MISFVIPCYNEQFYIAYCIQSIKKEAAMNCGDWVESCTALVENHDGSFEIIKWESNINVVE